MNVSLLMLELREPFPPSKVSWRIARVVDDQGDKGKAQVLAYIDARDVMDRLDYVCGIEGWQCKYTHTATKTVCDIGLRIDGEWVWKSDGAGDTDVEAEKGALSDAFKRAAVRWGIGRYLYDLGNNYAEVYKPPKSKNWFITPEAQKTLEKLLPRGGTLKMEDARPLYTKLETEMGKITEADMLKAWADSVKGDVLKLPSYWQLDFIEKFTHHKSTLARAA